MKVRLLPVAQSDIAQAAVWYEEKREGLGVEFLGRVEQVLDRIAANPTLFAPVIDDVRRANLEQFPFGVWYRVKQDAIVVACLHGRRSVALSKGRARMTEFEP